MSVFSALMFESKKNLDGFGCMLEDIPIQLHEDMSVALVKCRNQEKVLDACDRMLRLCDEIENNDGKLDTAVRSFVNNNNELAEALGINLAMEEITDGAEVQSKKPGIIKTIWLAIKKFILLIINAIGSVFHWLGNIFSTTDQKAVWLAGDGIAVSKKLMNMSTEQQVEIMARGTAIGAGRVEKDVAAYGASLGINGTEDYKESFGSSGTTEELKVKSADDLLGLAKGGIQIAPVLIQLIKAAASGDAPTIENAAAQAKQQIQNNIPGAPAGAFPKRVTIMISSMTRLEKPTDFKTLYQTNWLSEEGLGNRLKDTKAALLQFKDALAPAERALKDLEAHIKASENNLDSIGNKKALDMKERIKTAGGLLADGVRYCANLSKAYATWVTKAEAMLKPFNK